VRPEHSRDRLHGFGRAALVHQPIDLAEQLRAGDRRGANVEAGKPKDALGIHSFGRVPNPTPTSVDCPALIGEPVGGVQFVFARKGFLRQLLE